VLLFQSAELVKDPSLRATCKHGESSHLTEYQVLSGLASVHSEETLKNRLGTPLKHTSLTSQPSYQWSDGTEHENVFKLINS
jgi:hypothetical protein